MSKNDEDEKLVNFIFYVLIPIMAGFFVFLVLGILWNAGRVFFGLTQENKILLMVGFIMVIVVLVILWITGMGFILVMAKIDKMRNTSKKELGETIE